MLWRSCDEAQRRQGVAACCDRDVAGAPAGRQRTPALGGQHHHQGRGPGAFFEASEERAHCEGYGGAGTHRLRHRRQIVVAVMPQRCGGWRWRQSGVQHRAAIASGGVVLGPCLDGQRAGALLSGPCDPVREAQCCGAGHELLPRPLDMGGRMCGAGVRVRGKQRLERGQWRVPGVPDCLGTPRMPPPHVSSALTRTHLGPLLIAAVHVQGPGAPQVFPLGFGKRRHGMEPVLGKVFDLLARAQATVANAGERGDAKPARELCHLRSHGAGSVGLAREHCAGARRPVRVAEAAADPLQLPCVASAMGANGGQCVVCPCQGAPGHSRQTQAGRLRLVPRRTEPLLSPCVGPGQPLQVFPERLRITRVSSQPVTGGVCQRQRPGREARAVRDPPCHHWPQRQCPCSCRTQRRGAPHAASDVRDRPHRTTRRPVLHGERVLDGPQVRQRSLGSEGTPQHCALRLGTMTPMGTRTLESLPVGTRRRAPPMPRRRCATTGEVRGVDRQSGYKNNIFLEYNQGKTAI